ncbi:MAG: peptidoglycan-associated lipoprotein Pal [Candidatus Eisenbacteria bacterium]
MSKRTPFAILVVMLMILPLIASCGSKKEIPLPEPIEKAPAPVKTEPVPEPKPVVEVDPDQKYDFQNIHFEFDKFRLQPQAQSMLTEHAKVLMRNPGWSVRIEGHCDERGTVEYNLALGEKRAKSAQDFLVRYGVKADKIGIISYGKERPVDAGHNEEAWAKNRRAEFHVSR